jgi:hypothetical protein
LRIDLYIEQLIMRTIVDYTVQNITSEKAVYRYAAVCCAGCACDCCCIKEWVMN